MSPPRGVWELSTSRLWDLAGALRSLGEARCTEIQLQLAGFDGPAAASLISMSGHHAYALVTAVLAERTANPRPQAELVWSGPEAAEATARDTSEVLRELFQAATERVIVAGYAFWDAAKIFEPLHRRALAVPLAIEFYIHIDSTGAKRAMTQAAFSTYTWPWTDVPIDVYANVAPASDDDGVMHAKCVIVDDAATFITSANFTGAAQDTNVEIGVLLRDRAFSVRAAAQWRQLASRRQFRRLTF